MRRFWVATAGAAVLVGAAMAATVAVPGFGAPMSHYHAGLVGTLLATALLGRAIATRRGATFLMASTGAVAAGTGFVMLLTRQFPYKEWLTWWHSVTSFAFTAAFLAHWVHNNARLAGFTRRLFAGDRAWGIAAAAAWAVLVAAGVWTAFDGASSITADNYLSVSLWTIVAGVAFPYGVWLAFRLPALHPRLVRHRNRARALVDTGLFLANWGALLTGFALLYLAEPLRAGALKYPSKWWHTATSVALLAFLALHVGFNARLLAAHARTVDRDLAREAEA